MRKVVLALVTVVVLLVVADFATAIYTEYRVSRAVRDGAGLDSDPEVTISAVPFLTAVPRGHAGSVTVRAHDVPTPVTGRTTVDAHFSGVTFDGAGPLVDPSAPITADRATVRWIIGQTSLGQILGVPQLEVESVPDDAADDPDEPTFGPPLSGHQVLLTGEVQTATDSSGPVRKEVSVIAYLVLDDGVLSIVPHAVQPRSATPGTSPDPTPPLEVVGPQFSARIETSGLPYGIAASSVHNDGTDLVIEGQAPNVTLSLDDLTTAAPETAKADR